MDDATRVSKYLKDKKNKIVQTDQVLKVIQRLQATTHETSDKATLLKAVIAFFDTPTVPACSSLQSSSPDPIDTREEEEESVTKLIHDYELSRKSIIARDPASILLHSGDTLASLTPVVYVSWIDRSLKMNVAKTVVRLFLPRYVKTSNPFVYLRLETGQTIACELSRTAETWDIYTPIVGGDTNIVQPGTYKSPEIVGADGRTIVCRNMPHKFGGITLTTTSLVCYTESGNRVVAKNSGGRPVVANISPEDLVYLPEMGFSIFLA